MGIQKSNEVQNMCSLVVFISLCSKQFKCWKMW